jgi:enterochelin esterase-like enzyme
MEKEYKIDGKSVEQYWTDKIKKNLIGRKITKVEYLTEGEMEENMWYKRPVAICLDDKYWLVPLMDDEGNDGGAISTTFKDLGTIPVI